MDNFITAIRNDRNDEIQQIESREIEIDNKNKYKIVEKITVKHNDEEYIYGVQANASEVYFYMIDNGANTYYTIIEIYELLKSICDSGNEEIVFNALEEIIKMDTSHADLKISEADQLHYRNNIYYINKIEYPSYNGFIETNEGAVDIEYLKLFILITLIQEKSNALYNRGESVKKEYLNGLVRLLYCLVKSDKDYEELKKLGWYYLPEIDRYKLYIEKSNERERKYYLTEQEYLGIMSKES